MITSSITIQNFRCFEINRFHLGEVTYIHGNNGSGKTAILEAISLVNWQNSFRAKTMESLIKDGDGIFEVMAETIHGNVFIQHDTQKKTLELDGDKTTAHHLKHLFHPVLFSPQYELALATPSSIRTFLDKLASYLFPEHDKLLNKCRELLSERIKILLTNGNPTWLSSIEEQIAQSLTVVSYNRLLLVQKLNAFLGEVSAGSTIEIVEKYINLLQEKHTFSHIEKQIAQDLLLSRNIDKAQNKNSVSINDAEYKIRFRKQKIDFCSSGQQKLMGTMLTLGVAFNLMQLGRSVITLLDDIVAKIDSYNQEHLHEIILFTKCQTVITSIDAPTWQNAHTISL